MVSSVNAFEVMVKSVSDNHLTTVSVFAPSSGLISSCRNLGCCLKLNRGQGGVSVN